MLLYRDRSRSRGGSISLTQRLRQMFASQALNGALYDYSNISSLNQLSTGTTPVTAVTDLVGLSLDSRLGLVLGPELSPSSGSSSGNWVWTGGIVTRNGSSAGSTQVAIDIAAGKFCIISIEVSNISGDTFYMQMGAGQINQITANGIYSFTLPVGTTVLKFAPWAGAAGECTISNISVKLLEGNHALQATAGARPTWTNRVNEVTYSQDLSNAAWSKNNTTIDASLYIAPDGTTTANKILETATTTTHTVSQIKTSTTGQLRTVSARLKAGERTWALCTEGNSVTAAAYFDLVNGVLGTVYGTGSPSATITALGDGWYLCTMSFTAGTNANCQFGPTTGDGGYIYAGDITKGIYVWGFQHELGTTATRYQRVTTATDFDTVGFPYYLSFLGTDDSLTSATGGGGSAGFFWCGVVQPTGGAGTLRTLFADNGANTGYKVQLDASNKLSFSAGNNTAFTTKASTATIDVGTKYLLTVWDDGTNLNVQINSAAAETVARPVVVAGTAGFTIGKDNGAASSFAIANIYSQVYFKDTGLTAAQRAAVQAWVRSKAGL